MKVNKTTVDQVTRDEYVRVMLTAEKRKKLFKSKDEARAPFELALAVLQTVRRNLGIPELELELRKDEVGDSFSVFERPPWKKISTVTADVKA